MTNQKQTNSFHGQSAIIRSPFVNFLAAWDGAPWPLILQAQCLLINLNILEVAMVTHSSAVAQREAGSTVSAPSSLNYSFAHCFQFVAHSCFVASTAAHL